MTSLWARMLVFYAWQENKITKECAQYFDELIRQHETATTPSAHHPSTVNCITMNGKDTYCVLGNIGTINDYSMEKRNFDVITYIKKTTYENGRRCGGHNKTAFLANVIYEDFSQLPTYISAYIKYGNTTRENLILIKNYLRNTQFIVSDKQIANYKTLIKDINDKLAEIEVENDIK